MDPPNTKLVQAFEEVRTESDLSRFARHVWHWNKRDLNLQKSSKMWFSRKGIERILLSRANDDDILGQKPFTEAEEHHLMELAEGLSGARA